MWVVATLPCPQRRKRPDPSRAVAAIHAGTGTHNLHAALAVAYELVHTASDVTIKPDNSCQSRNESQAV